MDCLKTLSVILDDTLSGPSWWLSFGLIFLIIIASTANKIFRLLQNLTTSEQLKILLWQILHCSICENTALFVGLVCSLILTNSCHTVSPIYWVSRSPGH